MASYKDIINIDIDKFLELGKVELKGYVKQLGSVVNRRLSRLQAKGYNTPATKYSKVSVRGKSLDLLRQEFIRAKNFLNLKSSTVRGANRIFNDFLNRMGVPMPRPKSRAYWENVEKRMWDVMSKLYQENGKLHTMEKSFCKKFQKRVYAYTENHPNLTPEQIATRLNLIVSLPHGENHIVRSSVDDIEVELNRILEISGETK